MGGGKGAIHHYATPVKAGRIVFEMGGYVEFDQVKTMLIEVSCLQLFERRRKFGSHSIAIKY